MRHLQRREVMFGLAGLALAPAVFGRVNMAFAADKIKPNASSALIVVDVQNCFLPGGSLAVKDGDQVIPVINRIAKSFDNVVMTQDSHPATKARSRSRSSSCPTATRCCGPTIACRAPRAPASPKASIFPRPC
jgi:nicotinamidase-related amidase